MVSGGIRLRLRVVPYTHSQLISVLKHFIYKCYDGFVKHSKWGLRLNHDVNTSDRSAPTPTFLCKLTQVDSGGYQAEAGAIYPFTAYQGAETLYIYTCYGFVKHSKWGLRLNHDVTTSDRLVPTPKFLYIDPRPRLSGGIRLRLVPYTHSQLIKVQKHFIYIYDMDL